MAELSDDVRTFIGESKTCVVATQRPDGRIRQSVVLAVLDGDQVLLSTEAKRHKAQDVDRTGWASVCFFGHERPYPSVTLEGPARVTHDPAEAGALTRRLAALLSGQPEKDAPSDEQIAAIGRIVVVVDVERVYGAMYLSGDQAPPGAARTA